jgi:ribose transport system substrate-binding protein
MSKYEMAVARRRFLLGASAIGAGTVLAGCASNEDKSKPAANNSAPAAGAGGGNDQPGKTVTIGFSAPAADHGWIAAITKNAKDQAGKHPDVKFEAVEGAKDANEQIPQVETLINKKVDVLVLLPYDGKALNEVGIKAMSAGIPVINLDRIFPSERAYRRGSVATTTAWASPPATTSPSRSRRRTSPTRSSPRSRAWTSWS